MNKVSISHLRSFAFIWSVIFATLTVIVVFKSEEINFYFIFISITFLLLGIFFPKALNTFYVIWVNIGNFIGNIISKIIMFFLYFSIFTISAFILKLFKKDLLNLGINKDENSYWIKREEQPQSMKKQF